MTTLAEMMKAAGISDYDERSSQDSLNQGAKPEDIVNWWKAKKGGTLSNAPAPDDMSLLLGLRPTGAGSNDGYVAELSDGRMPDGSIDEEAYQRFQQQQRLKAKYTDANGVFTPPKSVFGDLSKFSKDGGGNVHDLFSSLSSGRGVGGRDINDPSKVIHDPIYGDFIDKRYLGQSEGDTQDPLWRGISSAAKAAASMATGGATSLMEGGINYLGNATETGQWGGKALQNLGMSAAGAALGAFGGQAVGSLLPTEVVSAYNNVMPWVSGAKTAYNFAKNPSAGGAVGVGMTGLTLADIIKNYGMGG